jgi:hypothetical protein
VACSNPARLSVQNDRSHPRRLERSAAHSGQVGPPPGQSCPRRGCVERPRKGNVRGRQSAAGESRENSEGKCSSGWSRTFLLPNAMKPRPGWGDSGCSEGSSQAGLEPATLQLTAGCQSSILLVLRACGSDADDDVFSRRTVEPRSGTDLRHVD